MINLFKEINNMDNLIFKIMKIGFKFSFILCIFFTYILLQYILNPISHIIFEIGYLGIKCSIMFFVSFLVSAITANKLLNNI